MNDNNEVSAFYEKSLWPLGERVIDCDDPSRRGVLVRRVARLWVDRDSKPPMVRWDGKIDAVEIPWDQLHRARGERS
jgi:hypothetical protein